MKRAGVSLPNQSLHLSRPAHTHLWDSSLIFSSGGIPPSDRDVLTSELRDRLRYVEGQLEAERQAHAEARRIIAGLVERIPAIEAPQEASEASETVEEKPERAEPHSTTVESQEGTQRPWWRRVLGG